MTQATPPLAKGAVFSEIDHEELSVWDQPFVMDE